MVREGDGNATADSPERKEKKLRLVFRRREGFSAAEGKGKEKKKRRARRLTRESSEIWASVLRKKRGDARNSLKVENHPFFLEGTEGFLRKRKRRRTAGGSAYIYASEEEFRTYKRIPY